VAVGLSIATGVIQSAWVMQTQDRLTRQYYLAAEPGLPAVNRANALTVLDMQFGGRGIEH